MDKEYQDVQEQAWADGRLVVIAVMSIGPHAGKAICCITDRREFRRVMRDWARNDSHAHRLSVVSAVREAIMQAELTGEQEADMMNDICLLMALRAVGRCDEALLEASGLFSLSLSINSDETEPWDKRGFITRRDARIAAVGSLD